MLPTIVPRIAVAWGGAAAGVGTRRRGSTNASRACGRRGIESRRGSKIVVESHAVGVGEAVAGIAILEERPDVVEFRPDVGREVPVQPDREVGEIVAGDVLVVEGDRRIAGCDLPGAEARPLAFTNLADAEKILERLEPLVNAGFAVVGPMLAGEEGAQLGHVGVEEQVGPVDLVDDREGVF